MPNKKHSTGLSPEGDNGKKLTRPSILKPVIPPKKRDSPNASQERMDGYVSSGGIFATGYISQGASQSDAESVRFSNFKNYNQNYNTSVHQTIRKVSPMAGIG
jgi:hypothetical protein